MSAAPPIEVRPRYRERQRLAAADLDSQQSYLVAMRRRHMIGSHRWGIVRGLAPAAGLTAAVVQPGFAVDGYGRELVVPAPLTVPGTAFADLGTEQLELWLVYSLRAGPGGRRWRETALLRIEPGDGGAVDGRHPPGVPAGGHEPTPVSRAPDAGAPWPVYLGSVSRSGQQLVVDLAGRPYAGGVGERIAHPRGGDAIRVGGDEGGLAIDTGGIEPLVVEADGDLRVGADTKVTRGADVQARAVAFEPAPAPAEAAPWRAYRVRAADGRDDELRIEIAPLPAETEARRVGFAIGRRTGSRFRRCLVVNPDCSVRVRGDLTVQGRIVEGPIQLDPDDPRFAGALLARWLGGISSAGALLDALYGAAIAIEQVTLSGLALNPAPLDYKVVVRNSGTVPLKSVRTVMDVTAAGNDILTGEQIGLAQTVGAGETDLSDDRVFLPNVPGVVVQVVITATGVGPAGNTVIATMERTVTLEVVIG